MTAGSVGATTGDWQFVSLSNITTLKGTAVAASKAGSSVGEGDGVMPGWRVSVGRGTKVGRGSVGLGRAAGRRDEQADRNNTKKRRLDIFRIKPFYHQLAAPALNNIAM
jgi:hypothetical protein